MAERRMFAKTIIDSDAFLDMPLSTQSLYFHLSMRADDDGFVNSPMKIMRMVSANKNDMDLLIAKRFILVFESGVIVIKHWKIHNLIQSDRYKPTMYIDEKSRLEMKPNKAYKLLSDSMETPCIQDVSTPESQSRLGKVSLDKDNIPPLPPKGDESRFDDFWKAYPKKKAKADAEKAWNSKAVEGDKHIHAILSAIERQKQSTDWQKDNGKFIPFPATWLRGRRWEDSDGVDGKERMTDLDSFF